SLKPLVVDMDGTLLATDTLVESFVRNFFKRPFKTLSACFALAQGRAAFKRALVELGDIDVASLPANPDVISFLEQQRSSGRSLHLATAADDRIAQQVGERFGLFNEVTGSRNGENLKGEKKADFLQGVYPDGYVYAGDSRADLAVWSKAKGAVFVGVNSGVRRSAQRIGVEVEADFKSPVGQSKAQSWRKALRIHQWSKNVLVFAPLFLAHAYTDVDAIFNTIAGFFIMSLVASGTYILNDLSDLSADRRHKTKHARPFASGALPVSSGLVVGPLLIFAGLAASTAINLNFSATLLAYLIITLSYSFRLKREPLVDVLVLGILYSLRLLIGVVLIGVALSSWLIAFSLFFFYSMSLAKRHVELRAVSDKVDADAALPGRGYRPADWPVTLALGAASTVGSIIVIVLYLTEEAFPSGVYTSPQWLWAAPLLIMAWTQRIWLLAHRGQLDDDPVSFALKDPLSIGLGTALAVFFAAASIL
ncbi:MAG: UbiA family prenyltransferase, partial [Pseudomonadota bacterium]